MSTTRTEDAPNASAAANNDVTMLISQVNLMMDLLMRKEAELDRLRQAEPAPPKLNQIPYSEIGSQIPKFDGDKNHIDVES